LAHLGIIPDGGRRYARRSGISLQSSYAQSLCRVTETIQLATTVGFDEISIYALSVRNLQRATDEVEAVSRASVDWLGSFLSEPRFEIQHLGRADLLPSDYASILGRLTNRPSGGCEFRVNILAAYDPFEDCALAIQEGLFEEDPTTERPSRRPVDIVLRSGGGPAMLSGFLPLQCAYAEIKVFEGSYCELPLWVIHENLRDHLDRPRLQGL